MKNAILGMFITAALATVLIITTCISIFISTLNKETQLRNQVAAQIGERNAYYDKVWKVIAQRTQVTNASAEVRLKMVFALTEGRKASGEFVRLVHEQNPESAFSLKEFEELGNAIESQREGLFREEKKLLREYKEYQNLRGGVVSGMIINLAGRPQIEAPKVILSARTNDAADSGVDNETDLNLNINKGESK